MELHTCPIPLSKVDVIYRRSLGEPFPRFLGDRFQYVRELMVWNSYLFDMKSDISWGLLYFHDVKSIPEAFQNLIWVSHFSSLSCLTVHISLRRYEIFSPYWSATGKYVVFRFYSRRILLLSQSNIKGLTDVMSGHCDLNKHLNALGNTKYVLGVFKLMYWSAVSAYNSA